MEEVLHVCNQNNWSEKLTKKLLQAYGPEEKLANLGMLILEFAALTDGINIFQKMPHFGRGLSNNFDI